MYTNGKSLSSDTDFYKRQQEAIRQAKAASEYSQVRDNSNLTNNTYSESSRNKPFETPIPQFQEKVLPQETEREMFKRVEKEPEREAIRRVEHEHEHEHEHDALKQVEKGLDGIKNSIKDILKNIKEDDILIIALFFILFNDNKEDDFLMIFILIILFFT